MANQLRSFLSSAVIFLGLNSFAQLANWIPVPGGTNFPVNVSGQINGIARISQLKFHPTNTSKFYCVTGQGGLFLTNNQAASWTVAPGTETITAACAAICVDYTNDQNFFLGTGDANYYSNGIGILRSTNGGAHFTATSLTNCLVIEILQNPINSSEFVAATNKGIYKSTNNGVTWTAVTAVNLPFCDLKANATPSSQVLYATTLENVPQFFRSTDYGSTWTAITSGIVASTANIQEGARIAVTPADPNVVYFEVIGDGGIIHKSNDGGLNFHVKKAGGAPYLTFYSNNVTDVGQGNYNNTIAIDRNDPAKIWLQSHCTWFSADSGATWAVQTQWYADVHTDMHQIDKAPFDNTKLYCSNDGGVWLSNDDGYTWQAKSDGLYAYEIGDETGVSSLTKKDFVSIGTQDNGRLYANTNGWFTNGGGDDYAKRQFDYNGNIYFDGVDRQMNHTGATGPYNLPTTNWNSFGFNRTNPNLAFMGFTNVYRCTNLNAPSPNWTAITSFNQNIRAVHSCVADPNRLYVLLNNGTLYVSSNALAPVPTFYTSTFGGSASNLGSITSMANNADIVYVCANNSVYMSINAGVSWTNVTYNLPNVNHRRILSETYGGTQQLVFIATNNAVYYKKAGQTSWTNYSTQLPARRSPTGFSMFDDGTNQSRIRYASYGRAIFESTFDNLRAFDAQIVFKSDTAITCSNPSILVDNGSVGLNNAPITYTWNFPGGSPATVFTSSASVTYTSTGTYIFSLTVKDGLNSVSTKTLSKFIQVISCNTDTVPGNALYVNGTSNYAVTQPIALGNTNSITLSAWIKISATQPPFAGIISSDNGGATGLNFRNGNQIGYHYDDQPSSYNYNGGPVIAMNTWVHVALVTSASAATIYVNGVPYVNSAPHAPVNFTREFHLGNDRDNMSRTMTGQIDEVCFYNRSLSQNEIRELMHLTRNHNTTDPALKTYYQLNEAGQAIYDRAGNSNGILNGTSMHQISSAPVGSGNSERQTITTTGIKNFVNEGVDLNFTSATLPNGEICVTRLNIQPDAAPTNKTLANTASKYWIINSYGSNPSFGAVANIALAGYGTITNQQSYSPGKFKLYRRATGDFLATSWNKIDSAYATSTGTNGVLSYNSPAVSFFNTQFTVSKDSCLPSVAPGIIAANTTVCPGGSVLLLASGTLNDSGNWYWYSGSCGNTPVISIGGVLVSPTVTTTYYVRGEGGCSATSSSCTAITLSVLTVPSIPQSIQGPAAICQGHSKVYSVTAVPGATQYNWALPGGWTGSSSSNSILISPLSGAGTLSVSAGNTCGTSPLSLLNIGVTPSISASQTLHLCYGEKVSIGTNTYAASGTYTNLLTRSNGCDSLLVSTITIDPMIDASTTTTNMIISATTSGASYQWMDCNTNTILQGETGQNFNAVNDGSYAVIVTLNTCADTSNCVVLSTVGLKENILSGKVKIYPNPVTQKLTVETTLSSGTIHLSNALGQEISSKEVNSPKQVFDMGSLSNGVYFIKIESEEKKLVEKVIKE